MILMDKGQPGQTPSKQYWSGGAQLDEWQLWDINQPLLRLLLCQTSLAKVCNHNTWWRQVLHSSSGLLHLGAVPVNQFDDVLRCCDASFVGWKLSAISTSLNFEGRSTKLSQSDQLSVPFVAVTKTSVDWSVDLSDLLIFIKIDLSVSQDKSI